MQDKSGNPTLSQGILEKLRAREVADHATVGGTVSKILILLAITVVSAIFAWQITDTMPFVVMGGALVGLGLAFVIAFRPQQSATLAPLYAVAEGFLIGGLSYLFAQAYGSSIIIQAVGLTGAIALSTLFLYQARVVRVTEKFRSIVIIATVGIALYYLIALGLSFFGVSVPLIYDTGTAGIIFSLVVIFLAALNLLIDFDTIERATQAKLPKYFEWYGAFALLVTIVWLYIEVLRLLGKLKN